MSNRVFLDYDSGRSWLLRTWLRLTDPLCLRTDPLWDNSLEIVRIEARRLASMYPLGDTAVIMRSDNGYHLRFPGAKLSRDEEETVMWSSLSHFGHKWFSCLMRDTCLRVSSKPCKYSHPPYLVEIIKLEEIEHAPQRPCS